MLELRLAFKNLRRHKRRTLLTAVVIAYGVAAFSAVDSLITGVEEESLRNLVRFEAGQVMLVAPGYWAERSELPLDRTIPEAEKAAARLRRVPGVRGVTPRLVFPAALNNGGEETPVRAVGLDPRAAAGALDLRQAVKAGRYLREGSEEALVGRELADLLELEVGSEFTLILRTRARSFEALDLRVAGILDSDYPLVNNGTVYLPLDVAQRAVDLPGAATEVLVAGVTGYRNSGPLADRIRQMAAELPGHPEVRTWKDAGADMLTFIASRRVISRFILAFITILAALGITNSILLAGLERVREIGTLKALGLTEERIVLLFMLEGLGIGLVGGLMGVALGTAAVGYLTSAGLDLSAINTGLAVQTFRGVWNPSSILGACAVATAASFLISYFPARRAARLDPAVALHSV